MLTISLEQLRFYANIGLYPEERILGNDILMDVHIRFEEGNGLIDDLSQTVDYAKVYHLIKNEMDKEHKLLETIAQNCIQLIKKTWPQIREVEIIIRKLHPLLSGEAGSSKVTLLQKF